jgi:hypothetical protein
MFAAAAAGRKKPADWTPPNKQSPQRPSHNTPLKNFDDFSLLQPKQSKRAIPDGYADRILYAKPVMISQTIQTTLS